MLSALLCFTVTCLSSYTTWNSNAEFLLQCATQNTAGYAVHTCVCVLKYSFVTVTILFLKKDKTLKFRNAIVSRRLFQMKTRQRSKNSSLADSSLVTCRRNESLKSSCVDSATHIHRIEITFFFFRYGNQTRTYRRGSAACHVDGMYL